MSHENRQRGLPALAGGAATALVAVFVLPYFFPLRQGFSDAWAFGWNTRAAEVVLVVAAALFAWWSGGLSLPIPHDRLCETSPVEPGRKLLGITVACTALACIAVWLWTRPTGAMQEASYFLDRYADFQLGARLYRDIEFSYGPLMFYPPLWLAHATGMLVGDAYFFCWTSQAVLGTVLLWWIVRQVAAEARHARALYVLLWAMLSTSLVDGGANYTALRCTAGLAVALAARRSLLRGRSAYAVLALAAAGTAAVFFYSPDIGLQCWAGLVLFFLLCWPDGVRSMAGAVAAGSAIFAAAVLLSITTGELTVLRQFSAGALALPLLAGPGTVVAVAVLLLAGCVVLWAFQSERRANPTVLLVVLSAAGLPGAMGRCDPGHMLLYTFGAWVAVGASLASSTRLWRPALVVAAADALVGFAAHAVLAHGVFFVPLRAMAVGEGGRQHPAIRALYVGAMRRGLGAAAASKKMAEFDAEASAPAHPLRPGTLLMAPLGALRRVEPWPGDLRIDSGRYAAWIESTPTVAQDKAAELAAHPGAPLLLPDGWQGLCTTSPSAMRRFEETVFLTPLVPPARHVVPSAAPLCRYVQQHYRASAFNAPMIGFEVWTPTGTRG